VCTPAPFVHCSKSFFVFTRFPSPRTLLCNVTRAPHVFFVRWRVLWLRYTTAHSFPIVVSFLTSPSHSIFWLKVLALNVFFKSPPPPIPQWFNPHPFHLHLLAFHRHLINFYLLVFYPHPPLSFMQYPFALFQAVVFILSTNE